jgi:hypothetical protein
MKKKGLFFILIAIAISLTYHFTTQKSAIELLKEKHALFLKNHPYTKTLQLTKKQRKANGIAPNKYFEQEYLLEINPNTGRTHPENIVRVQKELNRQRKQERVPGDATDNEWVERGPNNVGGRTRVVLFDPNDATHKRVFAGGVSGGLWVHNDITNTTFSWTSVGIDKNLSVSCITVDPNNTQIMYVGTGESQVNSFGAGNGVWKSTNGGATWVNVYSDSFNPNLRDRLYYINTIKAWNNPVTNQTEVFIGVAGSFVGNSQFPGANSNGLYKSVDAGVSWNKVVLPTIPGTTPGSFNANYEPNDIEISVDNTIWIGTENNVWGTGGGTILKSTDGTTFSIGYTLLTSNPRRVKIAVSKQNANTIYVLASNSNNDLDNNPIEPYLTLLKTTNAFSTTTTVALPNDADTDILASDFARGQAFYNLVIEVDPTDDTKIYAGGIDLFRSTNSGGTWKQISKWSNNNNLGALTVPLVHADQHAWAFHPTDANKAIIGNDGGVYYASSLSGAESSTIAIQERNKDYNVTQFYHGEIGQSASNELLLSGSQDNGTQFSNGSSSGINATIQVYDGDGAYSFIDKGGAYMIASNVYNNKVRLNLPYTGAGIALDSDSDSGEFINPQDLDDTLDILYSNASDVGGDFDSIVRYSGIKNGQTLIKKRLGNPLLTESATALKVSPYTTTATKLYIGTEDGDLLKITNANGTPVWTSIGSSNFLGSISSIAFGSNEDKIMVTFHNYGIESIFYTENGGTTWTSKEGDLPDIPVKAVMMNPLNTDEVIIGTELGVWRTGNFKDASPTWSQSDNGMSDVKVTSFSLRAADNTVMATTYGRGVFTGQFTTGVASIEDVEKESAIFTIYPTVSNGDFTVFAKNSLGKAKLDVFDSNAREVYSKQLDFTEQSKQAISVNLTSGMYIVHLIGANNKKATSKVIIK